MIIIHGISDDDRDTRDDVAIRLDPDKIVAIGRDINNRTYIIATAANPEGAICFHVQETREEVATLKAVWENRHNFAGSDEVYVSVELLDGAPKFTFFDLPIK
jgi:hypothetical protein